GNVVRGPHREHPGQRTRGGEIDPPDRAVGVARANDAHVQLVREGDVAGEAAAPADHGRIFQALDRLADPLAVIVAAALEWTASPRLTGGIDTWRGAPVKNKAAMQHMPTIVATRTGGGSFMRVFSAAVLALAVAAAAPAHAQESWPQRQVTIVVPFSAGGSADLIARIFAQHLQAKFGTPFVVENRGGAGGSIGAAYAAKAPNDGYTLFIGTVSTNAINPWLYSKLPFDVERDFQPISLLVQLPNLLFVNPKIPVKTVPELIAHLKANDGKVNHGSSGIGTSSPPSPVLFQTPPPTTTIPAPFPSPPDTRH